MKKILALIICLCITASVCPSFAASQQYSDSNVQAAEILQAIGIMEGAKDGDLMLDNFVTRAEFVTLIVRMLGLGEQTGVIYFDDVNAKHWAAGSIATACAMGLINGVDENNFAPDMPVTVEQAIKILVIALGYQARAEAKGGYPYGYSAIANEIDLYDNISASNNTILRRAVTAQLILNSLNASYMDFNGMGDGDIYVSSASGETLLNKLDMITGGGVLKQTAVSSLSHSGGANGKVVIGDKELFEGEVEATGYLGYYVTYYAKKTDNGYQLIYIASNDNRNTVHYALWDDILADSDLSKIVYSENGKKRTVKLSPYADWIKNGVSIGGISDISEIIPAYGDITVIDNDMDGYADVVTARDFNKSIVADNVSGNIVKSEKNSADVIKFDYENTDYRYAIYKDGKAVDMSAITKGSVLSIAESTNTSGEKLVSVYLSDTTAEGVLEGISDSYVVLGGAEYKYKPAIRSDLNKLINQNAVLYIDILGNVVGTDEGGESSFSYGYIIKGGMEQGVSGKLLLKMLIANGGVEVLKCADKIKLDGTAQVNADTSLLNTLDLINSTATPQVLDSSIEQLVKYKANSKGEIIAVDTIAAGSGDEEYDSLKKSFGTVGTNARRYMNGTMGGAAVEYLTDESIKVFVIPAASEKDDDGAYFVGDNTVFVQNEYYDNSEAFDFEDGFVGAAVIYDAGDTSAAFPSSEYPSIIINKQQSITPDGDLTYTLTLRRFNEEVRYMLKNADLIKTGDTSHSDYVVGDIIRCALDKNGYVRRIEKILYKEDANGFYGVGSNTTKFYATFGAEYGYLRSYKNDVMLIDIDGSDTTDNDARAYKVQSNTTFFTFNSNRNIFTQITASDLGGYINSINAACKAVVVTNSGKANMVIIYE